MGIWQPKTLTSFFHFVKPPEQLIHERNKIKILRDQRYSSRDKRLLADIYLPMNGKLTNPAILMVHGGGWASRSKEDMNWSAEYYSKRGYTVVNINYRLAPQYLYPAPLLDLKAAFEWMLSNKENFRINKDKIILMGYSAGGHLTSLLSGHVTSNKPDFAHLKHCAVISGGAPYDFMVYPQSPYINRFTSFYRDENPELYLEASPLSYVSSQSVPHFLYHAKKDRLVEFEQMIKYELALKKNGIKVASFTVGRFDHVSTFLLATAPIVNSLHFVEDQVF